MELEICHGLYYFVICTLVLRLTLLILKQYTRLINKYTDHIH